MSEEFDLTAALEKANTLKDEANPKKQNRAGIIFAATLGLVIVGGFVWATTSWFAENDFSHPISLTEDIKKWTSLEWSAEGDFKKNHHNVFGEWDFNNKTGNFVNTELGCSALFTTVVGDYGDFGNDLEDTKRYERKFIEGQEETAKTQTVVIPLENYSNGGIEAYKTYYINGDSKPSVAYYRHSPASETIFLGIISCETEETLEKVSPFKGNGSELETLGFKLKA